MNKPSDLNFKPGPEETPPFLAGRKKEKEEIKLILDRLKDGKSPGQNIVLIGPRGNGKTVLMQWVKEGVDSYKGKVKCVTLKSHCFRTHGDLVESLKSPEESPEGFKVERIMAKTPIFDVEVPRREAKKEMLGDVLERRCSESGFAILIDEAHTLNVYPDEVRNFFHEVQILASSGCPLLLILAGTPNISRRFTDIEISFWNRIKKFGIGLLDDVDAKEALRTPLNQMGYNIKDKVLDRAVSEAQRYPYFLQIVGSKLHRVAEAELGIGRKKEEKEINCAILDQALTEFAAERDNYYNLRYRELREDGILHVAYAVASRFVLLNERSITGGALEVTIESCVDGKELTDNEVTELAVDFESKLRDNGFIWSPIGKERCCCEPGIPSLMNYILEWKDDRDRELARIRGS